MLEGTPLQSLGGLVEGSNDDSLALVLDGDSKVFKDKWRLGPVNSIGLGVIRSVYRTMKDLY